MAEFKTVIEEYRRMCASLRCEDCVFGKLENQCENIFDEMEPENIENVVMAWSKNHPKKVYPSWKEWLEEIGLIYKVTTYGLTTNKMTGKMYEPIPDDIAEKLNIKPKNEGK